MAIAPSDEILRMADIIKDTVPAERIYLFGSYAYGVPDKNSDYDFYVVLPDGLISPHDAVRKIRHALSRRGRRIPVDIIARDAESFDDRCSLLTLERKAANEGVLLYGQEGPRLRMA